MKIQDAKLFEADGYKGAGADPVATELARLSFIAREEQTPNRPRIVRKLKGSTFRARRQ